MEPLKEEKKKETLPRMLRTEPIGLLTNATNHGTHHRLFLQLCHLPSSRGSFYSRAVYRELMGFLSTDAFHPYAPRPFADPLPAASSLFISLALPPTELPLTCLTPSSSIRFSEKQLEIPLAFTLEFLIVEHRSSSTAFSKITAGSCKANGCSYSLLG